jgi:hypothetical protein
VTDGDVRVTLSDDALGLNVGDQAIVMTHEEWRRLRALVKRVEALEPRLALRPLPPLPGDES